MTSQHSPEPWKWVEHMASHGAPTDDYCNHGGITDALGNPVYWFGNDEQYDRTDGDEPSKADAERIIACVNTCAGIPTNELHKLKAWLSDYRNLYQEGM